MKKVPIPSRLWYENTEWDLTFPDRWEVDTVNSPGFDKPALGPEQIKEKIDNPCEGPSLEELAKDKSEAVIVFDDMTRPTPVKDIAPHVVDALHRAGMKKEQIRFLWSLGAHGAYDMINARKKLGEEIVENYAVFNHDPFQNTVRVGRTPTGVELWFNREFMACDLKIGIGCITPHVHVGYGGGAKIILPGVAGIESINQFHNQLFRAPQTTGLGNFDNNIMRAEVDAAGDLSGLNFKVDCLLNRRGEITNLYAGPFRTTHTLGAQEGIEHYGATAGSRYDIVVANSYAKANESAISFLVAMKLMKIKESTVVLIFDAPEGQVPHYVMRQWGKHYGGRHYAPRPPGFVLNLVKKFIVMAPYPDRTSLDLICSPDDAIIVKTWREVQSILEEDYPDDARAAVVPDGTMQYLKSNE